MVVVVRRAVVQHVAHVAPRINPADVERRRSNRRAHGGGVALAAAFIVRLPRLHATNPRQLRQVVERARPVPLASAEYDALLAAVHHYAEGGQHLALVPVFLKPEPGGPRLISRCGAQTQEVERIRRLPMKGGDRRERPLVGLRWHCRPAAATDGRHRRRKQQEQAHRALGCL